MPKTRQKKEAVVKDYTEKLGQAKGLVFANFSGLKVKEIEALRKQCRQEKVDYLVAKKTLMKLAFKASPVKDLDLKTFTSEVATIFGYDDEVAPARIVGQFSKEHEALKPIGGVLENKFIDQAMVMQLANLPSRHELLAKVVGSIQAPVSGFVRVLSGNLRRLVLALNAIKETKNS